MREPPVEQPNCEEWRVWYQTMCEEWVDLALAHLRRDVLALMGQSRRL